MTDLAQALSEGDPRAIARAISAVENDPEAAQTLLTRIHRHLGKAIRLGITGPPGVGKSTLINEIAIHKKKEGRRVGVIAVDPTSPFTGGALLGDRVRMSKATEDDSIFVRSMASRGMPGGIAKATCDAADILDAAGKDLIIIETVGVGQSEVEVSKFSDCTLVVLSPESGDAIQAMKSGLMEVADIVVINKKDRPGADALTHDVRSAFQLGLRKRTAEFVQTAAVKGEGTSDLIGTIERFLQDARTSGGFERRRHRVLVHRLRSACEFMVHQMMWEHTDSGPLLEQAAQDVLNGSRALYDAAQELLKKLKP
jgi:LAO/AO transport system kinase